MQRPVRYRVVLRHPVATGWHEFEFQDQLSRQPSRSLATDQRQMRRDHKTRQSTLHEADKHSTFRQ